MQNREMNKQGVGLGLTISKNLAKALGGDITVVSQVDIGSQFILTLPFEPIQENSTSETTNEYDAVISDAHILIEGMSDFNYNDNQNLNFTPFNRRESLPRKCLPKGKNQMNFNKSKLNKQNTNYKFHSDNIGIEKYQSLLKKGNTGLIDDDNFLGKEVLIKKGKQSQKNKVKDKNNNSKAQNGQSFFILNSEISNTVDQNNNAIQQVNCDCAKILIVDDDPYNLMALEGLLRQLKVDKVDQCFNGKQALEKILENQRKSCLHHQSYDLIITDNQMPVMSGIQLTKELRIIQQQQNNLKIGRVVLLTGDESMLSNQEYSHLFDDIILKPIDSNILELQLAIACKKHQDQI
eukprot:403338613